MNLENELLSIKQDAEYALNVAKDETTIDSIKSVYLGKKGKLTDILKQLGTLPIEEKKIIGKSANEIASFLENLANDRKIFLQEEYYTHELQKEFFDALRPIPEQDTGSLHPITLIQYEIEDIFTSMGFSIKDGPEIETDYNNFEALNFTEDHPARDMQDTFYIKNGFLLRTHTSAIQARALRELTPPFRIIAPGRVYRYEEVDASHEHTFYQIEGMVLGKDISIANLIHTMNVLLENIFKQKVKTRLRPGYFPFVEPGFELDISCTVCSGKGCPVCKHSGWLELLPCGLIHPNVIRFAGHDPEKWTGFAFGLGLDRLVMMRYGINDIRYFHSGNLRFLKQFA